MNFGRFSKLRQKRYSCAAGLLMSTECSTWMPRWPPSFWRVSESRSAMMPVPLPRARWLNPRFSAYAARAPAATSGNHR